MRALWLVVASVLAACASQDVAARPHGGAATSCAIGNDGGLCAAAPAGGLKQDVNFFTTAKQSGQGDYYNSAGVVSAYPLDHDQAGITYGIGQVTPDSSLIDAKVSPPTGCTWNAGSVTLFCAAASIDMSHYKLIGGGVTVNGNSGLGTVVTNFKMFDSHIQATAASCNRFTGLALIQGGNAKMDVTNNTFDYDTTCANNSQQYKTAGDPGLVDQSSGTATVDGNLLHYTSPPTGSVQPTQYIACSGCVGPARIISGSYPDYLIENPTIHRRLNGVQINGTHLTYTGWWNGSTLTAGVATGMVVGDVVTGTGIALNTRLVTDNGGGDWTVSISQTALSPGSVVGVSAPQTVTTATTVTTSPMESTFNAAIAAHGGVLGATYRYNWSEGFPTMFGESGGGNLDVQANMAIMSGRSAHPLTNSTANDGQHDQFLAWLPGPGSTVTGVESIQDYNTILSQAYSADGIWTSFMSQFSTCSACSPAAASNYLISFDLVSFSHNLIIGNKSKNNPTAAMTFSMWRVLSQTGGMATGNVTWSLSAGVVTILSVNSGAVGVGDTIACISFPSCAKAVVLTSQIDATHFNTSNTVDTKTSVTNNVIHFPGQFTLLRAIGNGYDQTGNNGGTTSIDWPNIDIQSSDIRDSWNLLDGSAAN